MNTFKVNKRTPERGNWRPSGVFIINFEQISHIALVIDSILDFEIVNASCEMPAIVNTDLSSKNQATYYYYWMINVISSIYIE